jgi:hypothetical protein
MPTVYLTVPNSYPINIDMIQALAGSPGVNCVTMSVANLCYGAGVTGSYTLVFTGSVSGSYGNTAISASTQKNNCPTCQTGSFYTTIVPADAFTSTASQANANAQALAYLTSVSQSNANSFGSCSINTFYNIQISGSITKNDCPTCQTGSSVLYTIPASSSMFTNTCSLSEANTSASIYFAATSQSYANTNGTCSINYYYNTQISASVQRNDCAVCYTGSFSLVTVPASQSVSTCSLSEAQTSAQNYFNSVSQSWANASGSCDTGSTFCFTLRSTFQTDVQDTSNFPVTMSYLYTSSAASGSANAPAENDPKWAIAGYISSSQNSGSVNYDLNGITATSGSYVWVKPRDKNNEKIMFVGINEGNGPAFMFGATQITSFGQTVTVPLESKPKLYNNFTQSLGLANDIVTQPILTGDLLISGTLKPITASFLYTSSTDFPDANDAKFRVHSYFTVPSGLDGLEPVYITGSLINSDVASYVSQSNYYYFKFVDLNGNPIQYTSGQAWTTNSASIAVSSCGNIVKVAYTMTPFSASDATFANFRVDKVGLYYNTAISATVQKNDCSAGPEYGTFVNVSIPASQSYSSCSQADAQSQAQIYFNSVSQSLANTSGSCFTTQSVRFYFDQYMDVTDTGSLYPLTASIYRNTTTASMPLENDSKWTPFTYISNSLYHSSYINQPQANTFIFVSGGYSGSNLYKIRGAGGQKIDIDSGTRVTWNGTSSVYMYYEFPKVETLIIPGTASVHPTIGSSKQLFGNKSQSLSTDINNYIGFSITNLGIQTGSITASAIYSTSSVYPSFSETGWNTIGFISSSTSPLPGLFVSGIYLAGLVTPPTYQNPNGSLWATGSGYLYFRFQSGSTQVIPKTSSYIDNASFSQLTGTASVSGGIVRAEYTVFSSSMENSSRLNLR